MRSSPNAARSPTGTTRSSATFPGVGLPPRPSGRRSAWHLYPVEIDPDAFGCERDTVIDALRAEGIEATLHYPAVHLLALYRERGGVAGTAPQAERLCERLVTLPLYPRDDRVRSGRRRDRAAPDTSVGGGARSRS